MNLNSLKNIFTARANGGLHSATLVRGARMVWRGTIAGLAFLAVGAILFDGYIFVYRVLDLEDRSSQIDESEQVQKINNALFNEIKSVMRARAEVLTNSGANLPQRNPFLETTPKKQ